MDDSLLFKFDRFSGMNNVEQSFRLPSTRDAQYHTINDVSAIENMDIGNSMTLATRPGSDSKLSGTDMHSLWSDQKLIAVFVDNGILYQLTPQYSKLALGAVGNTRMSYAPWNDKIYMTNGVYIGYLLNGAMSTLSNPNIKYKMPLPAGKFITYFRARLYVAKGRVLYSSDALCDHYDIRTGFRVLENEITMLRAVDDGIYVSDGKTWFLVEKRAFADDPGELRKEPALDSDAIPYTDVVINGSDLADGVAGNYLMWTSADGVCLGDSSGKVKNLTRARYAMAPCAVGGAVVRNINETVHYISVLQ